MSLKKEKEKALLLRQQGFSYGYILKELGLKSKGTLSCWFKDLVLSEASKEKLRKNVELSIKIGLHEFNKKRSERIQEENKLAFEKGRDEIRVLSKKDLLILGASLYWGEGTKYETTHPSLIFTNSDPNMIATYMHFLREGLEIEERLIKAGIHVHPYVNISAAKKFWSEITHLHKDIFYIVSVVSSASAGKRSKRKLPYGMVVIKVNKREVFYRVKGMIEALKNKRKETWQSG